MSQHEQPQPNSVNTVLLELLTQPALQSLETHQAAAFCIEAAAAYEHEAVVLTHLGEGSRKLATQITVHGLDRTIKHLQDGGLPTESIALETTAQNRASSPVALPIEADSGEDFFRPWEAFVSNGKAPTVRGPRNIPKRSVVTGEELETEAELRLRVTRHIAEERDNNALQQFFRVGQEFFGVMPDPALDEQEEREALHDMAEQARAAENAYNAGERTPPDPARAIQREAFANAQAKEGSIAPEVPNSATGGSWRPK